ncbi:MAG TPA: class I SAM-dependent methyltransferase [Firmicutes bacterium]|jgi:ubiquinone/menaquinone biosynthesis C-methylase UbiE|nr:class I SAM-dependent methyltransferase [Bacillota bacterium]
MTELEDEADNRLYILFWQLYALVYDRILLSLLPYRRLQDAVAKSLNPRSEAYILDAGCGTGNLLYHLIRLKPEVKAVGIDFAPAMIRRARLKCRKYRTHRQRIYLRKVDLNSKIPYNNGEFQAVACINVLYAVKRPDFLLREINRVLKDRGRLVLVTPPYQPKMGPIFIEHVENMKNRRPYFWPFFLAGQLLSLAPWLFTFLILNMFIKKQESFHFLKEEELVSLVESCGFKLISLKKIYGNQDWFLEAEKINEKPGNKISFSN